MNFTHRVNKKIAFHYKLPLRCCALKANQTVPMSLRLSPELNARLEECAKRAKQKKHTLAQAAIEAAVAAIETSGGYLVVPIEFDVVRVPAQRSRDIEKLADEIVAEQHKKVLNSLPGDATAGISRKPGSVGPDDPSASPTPGLAPQSSQLIASEVTGSEHKRKALDRKKGSTHP